MDDNNWVPAPGQGAEPPVETGDDWRTQLSPEARQRVVHKLMETLRKHVPFSDQDQAGLEQLKNLAMRCEEKIYNTAVNQPDYMRKICIKMLTMESKSQNINSNALPSNSPGNSNSAPDSGASHNMEPQVPNSGKLLSVPISTNQSQGHQEIMSQNMPNNIGSTGIQSSASLASALPPVSGLSQTSIPSVVGQNPTMQNTSGVPQNPAGSSLGQGVPSNNMFANSQRQIPGRQQILPQQQEQPQSPQRYLYQQQFLKQKFQQQGNLQHTIVPSNLQPQQQNLIHPTSQQSGLQSSMIRSSDLSGMQQNLPSPAQQSTLSMLQHPQSVLRQQHQAASFRQQQQTMMQQSLLPSQKHIMVQQPNAANMQKNQLTGQQQRLLDQQINLQNLQQHQHQQQLMSQKNNFSSIHQQQLGSQGNVSGLQQQQQQLGMQSGNSTMQSNQHSLRMMQHPKVPMKQQSLHNVANMLPTQGQQSQQQLTQQQMKSQMQSTHIQRQLGLQQPNPLQLDIKPGIQASTQLPGTSLQQQNVIDQQRQLYQSQRTIPEISSTSLDSTAQTGQSNGDDWREELHQKIKAMKEMYLPELNDLHQRIALKLQQHDSLPQQPKSEQPEKLKTFKTVLERMMLFLHVSKDNITPSFKEKLAPYEKQIMSFINTNRVRKPIPPRQQGHLGQPNIQQPQSQASQVQSHDNQMQGSVQNQNLQQNSMGTMQNTFLSSVSGVSTPQQNIMNSVQISSSLDLGQGKAIGSLQQTAVGPLQQVNATNFSSQCGANMIQSNRNMLQHHQELHSQHLKKQQMMQQQQQLYQQTKQHLPAQIQAHQMSQANQRNDVNELKVKQHLPGLQQNISGGQRSTYSHQQMKAGGTFPISSPQLLQTASPQLSEYSSPQNDQQNLPPSLTKAGTPLQSGNSPFMVPSPSTPLAPSPVPGDSGKPISGVSPLSKAAVNIVQQQVTATHPSAPSLAIGTPGISASPLLAELTVSDGGGNVNDVSNIASGESNVTEKPFERLIKAVKSISSEALTAAVGDISSVVSMMDSIAGSAPDNTSRAAVGDNLVAMTNCRLQARKYIARDGITGTRKMKRDIVSSAGSVSDRINISGQYTPDLESTATSRFKRPRLEPNRALLEEISEINSQLIDTVVDVCEKDTDPTTAAEGGEGTIVKCSYIGAALSPTLRSQCASAQMSPIQPIRLLVPTNYPICSPKLLGKLPIEFSDECEDLSVKARSRLERSLRCLQDPMSLEEIARTWDVCARAVIAEYAQQNGGGTFSSKYGTWVDCSSAA